MQHIHILQEEAGGGGFSGGGGGRRRWWPEWAEDKGLYLDFIKREKFYEIKKQYDTDAYTVTLPNSYVIDYNTGNELRAYRDNGNTIFQIDYSDKIYSKMIVTEEYMNYLFDVLKEAYGSDIKKNSYKRWLHRIRS